MIPLTNQPDDDEELKLAAAQAAEEDVELVNEEEEETRQTPGFQPERIVASQHSQRNKNKNYLVSNQERERTHNRPFTVEEHYPRRKKYFEPVQEEPEGIEDLDENGFRQPERLETRSYRRDSRVDKSCADILLFHSTQKELIEATTNLNCSEVFTFNEVMKKIEKSLVQASKVSSSKIGYKYLVIDTSNMTSKLDLKHQLPSIKKIYSDNNRDDEEQSRVNQLVIIVFWVESNGFNSLEMLKEEVGTSNVQLFQKPVNEAEVKAIF